MSQRPYGNSNSVEAQIVSAVIQQRYGSQTVSQTLADDIESDSFYKELNEDRKAEIAEAEAWSGVPYSSLSDAEVAEARGLYEERRERVLRRRKGRRH